ncbi:MAG TPA: acetyl-CoA acetyltransferase [Acidimicrobiia bacterium]|nr:acetyl-CoA acetyltransferase [Acidimicrobiia bacterium]
MPDIPDRMPVLVGAGAAAGPPGDDPIGRPEAIDLMVDALRAAVDDAGAPALLGAIDRIAVPQGTWGYRDPARLIADRVGADRARGVLVGLGIPQQTLINDALRDLASGALDVVVVVGGEAKLRDALARRAGVDVPTAAEADDAKPDEHQVPKAEIVAPAEIDARLVVPVQQYALIENALAHAEGQSQVEHLDDLARLWVACNEVARTNPYAAFPAPRDADFLREPTADNRRLAFPYNKWHATQWTVDQAAALILCSADAARAHGVAPERWVLPHVGIESSLSVSLSKRADLHTWPAMRVLGAAAERHVGRLLAEVEHAELYSCFPAAVRVQQRELGLPHDGVPTITGGMAFAGGPFNNFVYQATAAMAERVRAEPGTLGLVTTVSGLLTKPGLAIWSTEPPAAGPMVADLEAESRAATAEVDSIAGYTGPATIATYTVMDGANGPEQVAVIGDTPAGARCVAVATDADLAERAIAEDLIGTAIEVRGTEFIGLD